MVSELYVWSEMICFIFESLALFPMLFDICFPLRTFLKTFEAKGERVSLESPGHSTPKVDSPLRRFEHFEAKGGLGGASKTRFKSGRK